MGAGSAAAYSGASFGGTVVDGAQDLSDEAFAPLAEIAAQIAKGEIDAAAMGSRYAAIAERIMCPNGPMAGLR